MICILWKPPVEQQDINCPDKTLIRKAECKIQKAGPKQHIYEEGSFKPS